MGLFDNYVKAKTQEIEKKTPKIEEIKPQKVIEPEEFKQEMERISNMILPIQRGIIRIESQQPIKNFNERLAHLDSDLEQLHAHCKMITKDVSKQEEIEWGEHYANLSKINQSIIVEHGRLKPLMLEVVARRTKDPLEDYPEYKGRVNIHLDELKTILKKEREFCDKVATQMETYLHHCWRPGIESYVKYAQFLEGFVLDRKGLEGEFRKSLEKQKYEVYMDNLPNYEIDEAGKMF